MNKSIIGLLYLLTLCLITVSHQVETTEEDSDEHDMIMTDKAATEESKHSHEDESSKNVSGDNAIDDDGEMKHKKFKYMKIFKSTSKKTHKHNMKKMRNEKKHKKEKMKCSMKEKKKADLDERFYYVWKSLLTVAEEVKRLQDPQTENRFPLECPPESNNETNCKMDEKSETCYGYGFCSCGICICNPQRHGRFCECEPCEHNTDGVQCGGPERGYCECGKCVCQSQYKGINCECDTNNTETSACQDQNDASLICSGNGHCVCNTCQCQEGYHGNLCQEPTECKKLQECVLCQAFSKEDSRCSNCNLEITLVDLLEVDENQHHCKVHGENKNCILNFAYAQSNDYEERMEIEVEKMNCKLN